MKTKRPPGSSDDARPRTSRRALWALGGALALIYALASNVFYIGWFNDDALYLLGARSLLSGSFANPALPGAPPIVQYLPGYSLLLCPVVWAFGAKSVQAAQFLSLLLTCGSLLWLLVLWEEELTPLPRFGAVLLAGLSPAAVTLSGTVMAEVPYLFCATATFWAASRNWGRTRARSWLLLGTLAGFGAVIRPPGLALPLALAVALALERRWKAAAAALVGGLAPLGLFLWRNQHVGGVANLYMSQLAGPLAGAPDRLGALGTIVASNAVFYATEAFGRELFAWPAASGRALWECLAGGLGVLLAVFGLRRTDLSSWRKFQWLHLLLYAAVLMVWPEQTGRYLLPALPFLAVLLLRGVADWEERLRASAPQATRTLLCLGLFFGLYSASRFVRASVLERTSLNTPPARTYLWLRGQGPASGYCAAQMSDRLFFHTGLKTLRLPQTDDPASLAIWATLNGVGHILVVRTDAVMKPFLPNPVHDPPVPAELDRLLSGSPMFRLEFSDPAEQTSVYRVDASILRPTM